MFFFKKFTTKTSLQKIPLHIAIIMDGNARWSKSKGLPISIGHKIGSENIKRIAESCIEFGVKNLTIYAFSSENWNRPQDEVQYLMKLLENYLDKETKSLIEKDVRILISGNLEKLSETIKSKIKNLESLTKNSQTLTLNVAFSYGSRQEIIDAVKKISLAVKEDKISFFDLDENFFSKNLYQPEIPDPDLLIRTAGDFRLSNFLLWQSAYTELYFTKVFWPDFSKKHLIKAINEFNKRERRYGKR